MKYVLLFVGVLLAVSMSGCATLVGAGLGYALGGREGARHGARAGSEIDVAMLSGSTSSRSGRAPTYRFQCNSQQAPMATPLTYRTEARFDALYACEELLREPCQCRVR